MNLILFGMKGCGKTFLGKLLAEKLALPFIDTDEQLSSFYPSCPKLPAKQLHHFLGEKGFRFLEKKAIFSLSSIRNTVIALGGGTLLDPKLQDFLFSLGKLVYLKTSLATLQARKVSFVYDTLENVYAQRITLYQTIAEETKDYVEIDTLSTPEILEKLTTLYHKGKTDGL